MSELPAFVPITPERIDALYQELFKAYDSVNAATKWSVRMQAVHILEREQERVTRIYEAFRQAKDAAPGTRDDAGEGQG